MYSTYFNNHKLDDYCVIRVLPQAIAGADETLSVEMDITIIDDVQRNIDMLNRILFTKEPAKLVIGDQPDRYLLCQLDGGIKFGSRFLKSDAKLKFKSEDKYWRSIEGEIGYRMDNEGRFIVDNRGTAPAVPYFKFDFNSESGFLGIITPNGYKTIGNPDEKDKLDIPEQETALNEEMHESDMSDWDPITTNDYDWKLVDGIWLSHPPAGATITDTLKGPWVPDYNKLNIGTGDPKFTEWGIGLKQSTRPKAGYYWNAWGYRRTFDEGVGTKSVNGNFRSDSRVIFEDNGGNNNGTGMLLIILMDTNNKPIMTTSIYNIDSNNNAAMFSAKVNTLTGDRTASKIIKEARFPKGFNGGVRMEREGDRFRWSWDSNKDQGSTSSSAPIIEKFNIGNTVYIMNTTQYYWHTNGTRYNVASFTRGRPHKVTDSRVYGGKRQYEISYDGVRIAWVNEGDLTGNKSGVGQTNTQTESYNRIEQFTFTSPELAKMNPWKLVVIGGTWDNSRAFTHAGITGTLLYRINGPGTFKEVKNQFQPGDTVEVDNATGQILHNGFSYQGFADYDNTNFLIDYGANELQVITSDWAELPDGIITFEERWR